MMLATRYIKNGYSIKVVLKTLKISVSSYYYQPKKGKKGLSKSTHTRTVEGVYVSNEKVVEQIEDLLSEEFVDYGYLKTTYYLRQTYSYIINAKKVYRLMSDNQLLNKKSRAKSQPRNWVKELVPNPLMAFEYLEFDIKYIYIRGANKYNRNALLLSVIDVKSRWLLGHVFAWTIKSEGVIKLFDEIFEHYDLPKRFYVRNDNGSQFIAIEVQKYFESKNVVQEFCKPSTPQQNAHIESYFSIVEKSVCQKCEFDDLLEAQNTMNRFAKFYNLKRIHSRVGYKSPYQYLVDTKLDLSKQLKCPALNCIPI